MVIERARVRAIQKPWGASDLRPWSEIRSKDLVGELWFENAEGSAFDPALLFKLLFTTEPLSIQVHPDDAFALKMGLARGKTEAWYILSATPGAKVAVGLTHRISSSQLREAIADGSIADLVQWRSVAEGDVIFIPPGTIHAIGAGLVIAEIQQKSDTTFRMYDYGRARALDIENAVAVADPGPARPQAEPRPYAVTRTILMADPHLVFESILLPPHSSWGFNPKLETWLFAMDGDARVGQLDQSIGEVVFALEERTQIDAGPLGFKALLAYPGPAPAADLLVNLSVASGDAPERPLGVISPSTIRTAAIPPSGPPL